MTHTLLRTFIARGFIAASLGSFSLAFAQDKKPTPPPPAPQNETKKTDAKDDKAAKDGAKKDDAKPAGDMAALPIKLPKPAFKGTPKDIPPGTNLEVPRKGPRPDFMAPKGSKNLAAGKAVTASDNDPIIGSLKLITDGDKEATEGSYVELGPGLQWVQIDLGEAREIYAIVIWHFHMNARVYHDVVIQVADDKDFTKNVRTIYSNDHDNSSGLGLGDQKEFWETNEGRLFDAKGVKAQFVRSYTKGSTADDQNHYTELEVWGK